MPRKKRVIIRPIALVLLVTFFASELAYAYPDASVATSILADPSCFETPVEFCALKEVYRAQGTSSGGGTPPPLLIHIQDAHTNLSGQENLAATLDYIMSKYDVSLILSEGGAEDCTLTPLKKIASPEVWKRIAKNYLIQGKISGEEYLNLTSNHPMKILGIEDIPLYLKSVQNYAELAEQRESILAYLDDIQSALDKLKNKLYPKELMEYEKDHAHNDGLGNYQKLLELAQARNIDLSEFPVVQKLVELSLSEKLIDFNLANLEQAALLEEIGEADSGQRTAEPNAKLSQFSFFQNILKKAEKRNILLTKYPHLLEYKDYLENFSKLDLDQVLGELEQVEDKVYVSAIPDKDALLVREIDLFLKLLKSAYRIQMTTHEFSQFKVNEPDFSDKAFLAFINRKLAEFGYYDQLIPENSLLQSGRKSLEAFYDTVSERDLVFMKNIAKVMDDKPQVAVLITGGYHTPHLKKLFKEKGYSYIVLAPLVESETNQNKYEKLLLSPIKPAAKKVEVVDGRLQLSKKKAENLRAFLVASGARFKGENTRNTLEELAEKASLASGKESTAAARAASEAVREVMESSAPRFASTHLADSASQVLYEMVTAMREQSERELKNPNQEGAIYKVRLGQSDIYYVDAPYDLMGEAFNRANMNIEHQPDVVPTLAETRRFYLGYRPSVIAAVLSGGEKPKDLSIREKKIIAEELTENNLYHGAYGDDFRVGKYARVFKEVVEDYKLSKDDFNLVEQSMIHFMEEEQWMLPNAAGSWELASDLDKIALIAVPRNLDDGRKSVDPNHGTRKDKKFDMDTILHEFGHAAHFTNLKVEYLVKDWYTNIQLTNRPLYDFMINFLKESGYEIDNNFDLRDTETIAYLINSPSVLTDIKRFRMETVTEKQYEALMPELEKFQEAIWQTIGEVHLGSFKKVGVISASRTATDKLGQCVTGDTLLPVLQKTEDRKQKAEKAKTNTKLVPIKDVQSGDYVLSLNEETQEIEPHRINALLDMGVKPVFKLTTASGRSIKTTANHPYLVRSGNEWIKVSELKVGDEIGVPIGDLFDPVSVAAGIDAVNYNTALQDVKTDTVLINSEPMGGRREILQRFGKIERVAGREIKPDLFHNSYSDYLIKLVKLPFAAGSKLDLVDQRLASFFLSVWNGTSPSFSASLKFFLSRSVSFGLMGKCDSISSISQPTGLEFQYSSGDAFSSNFSSEAQRISQMDCVSNTKYRGSPFFPIKTKALNPLGNANPFFLRSVGNLINFLMFSILRASLLEIFNAGNDFIDSTPYKTNYNIKLVNLFQPRMAWAGEVKTPSILWDPIVSIEPLGPEHVWDIEVDGTHNFIGNGIFAHNTYILENGPRSATTGSVMDTPSGFGTEKNRDLLTRAITENNPDKVFSALSPFVTDDELLLGKSVNPSELEKGDVVIAFNREQDDYQYGIVDQHHAQFKDSAPYLNLAWRIVPQELAETISLRQGSKIVRLDWRMSFYRVAKAEEVAPRGQASRTAESQTAIEVPMSADVGAPRVKYHFASGALSVTQEQIKYHKTVAGLNEKNVTEIASALNKGLTRGSVSSRRLGFVTYESEQIRKIVDETVDEMLDSDGSGKDGARTANEGSEGLNPIIIKFYDPGIRREGEPPGMISTSVPFYNRQLYEREQAAKSGGSQGIFSMSFKIPIPIALKVPEEDKGKNQGSRIAFSPELFKLNSNKMDAIEARRKEYLERLQRGKTTEIGGHYYFDEATKSWVMDWDKSGKSMDGAYQPTLRQGMFGNVHTHPNGDFASETDILIQLQKGPEHEAMIFTPRSTIIYHANLEIFEGYKNAGFLQIFEHVMNFMFNKELDRFAPFREFRNSLVKLTPPDQTPIDQNILTSVLFQAVMLMLREKFASMDFRKEWKTFLNYLGYDVTIIHYDTGGNIEKIEELSAKDKTLSPSDYRPILANEKRQAEFSNGEIYTQAFLQYFTGPTFNINPDESKEINPDTAQLVIQAQIDVMPDMDDPLVKEVLSIISKVAFIRALYNAMRLAIQEDSRLHPLLSAPAENLWRVGLARLIDPVQNQDIRLALSGLIKDPVWGELKGERSIQVINQKVMGSETIKTALRKIQEIESQSPKGARSSVSDFSRREFLKALSLAAFAAAMTNPLSAATNLAVNQLQLSERVKNVRKAIFAGSELKAYSSGPGHSLVIHPELKKLAEDWLAGKLGEIPLYTVAESIGERRKEGMVVNERDMAPLLGHLVFQEINKAFAGAPFRLTYTQLPDVGEDGHPLRGFGYYKKLKQEFNKIFGNDWNFGTNWFFELHFDSVDRQNVLINDNPPETNPRGLLLLKQTLSRGGFIEFGGLNGVLRATPKEMASRTRNLINLLKQKGVGKAPTVIELRIHRAVIGATGAASIPIHQMKSSGARFAYDSNKLPTTIVEKTPHSPSKAIRDYAAKRMNYFLQASDKKFSREDTVPLYFDLYWAPLYPELAHRRNVYEVPEVATKEIKITFFNQADARQAKIASNNAGVVPEEILAGIQLFNDLHLSAASRFAMTRYDKRLLSNSLMRQLIFRAAGTKEDVSNFLKLRNDPNFKEILEAVDQMPDSAIHKVSFASLKELNPETTAQSVKEVLTRPTFMSSVDLDFNQLLGDDINAVLLSAQMLNEPKFRVKPSELPRVQKIARHLYIILREIERLSREKDLVLLDQASAERLIQYLSNANLTSSERKKSARNFLELKKVRQSTESRKALLNVISEFESNLSVLKQNLQTPLGARLREISNAARMASLDRDSPIRWRTQGLDEANKLDNAVLRFESLMYRGNTVLGMIYGASLAEAQVETKEQVQSDQEGLNLLLATHKVASRFAKNEDHFPFLIAQRIGTVQFVTSPAQASAIVVYTPSGLAALTISNAPITTPVSGDVPEWIPAMAGSAQEAKRLYQEAVAQEPALAIDTARPVVIRRVTSKEKVKDPKVARKLAFEAEQKKILRSIAGPNVYVQFGTIEMGSDGKKFFQIHPESRFASFSDDVSALVGVDYGIVYEGELSQDFLDLAASEGAGIAATPKLGEDDNILFVSTGVFSVMLSRGNEVTSQLASLWDRLRNDPTVSFDQPTMNQLKSVPQGALAVQYERLLLRPTAISWDKFVLGARVALQAILSAA